MVVSKIELRQDRPVTRRLVLRLEGLAERDGLVLAGARPRSQPKDQPSRPRGPGSRRLGPDPEQAARLAAQDAAFPPSSLVASSSDEQYRAYWHMTKLDPHQVWVDTAVRITRHRMTCSPHAAIKNLAAGAGPPLSAPTIASCSPPRSRATP